MTEETRAYLTEILQIRALLICVGPRTAAKLRERFDKLDHASITDEGAIDQQRMCMSQFALVPKY